MSDQITNTQSEQDSFSQESMAQQLLQQAVTATHALHEKAEALRQTDPRSGLEALLQELDEEQRGQLEAGLQPYRQQTAELSAELQQVVLMLTDLHEKGQHLPAELALLRNAYLEHAASFQEAVAKVNRTVHNDVTTLNDNQLKFNNDVELLKTNFQQTAALQQKWLWGLAGALGLVLIFCFILLLRGNGSQTAAAKDKTSEMRAKLGLDDPAEEEAEPAESNTETEETSALPPQERLETPPEGQGDEYNVSALVEEMIAESSIRNAEVEEEPEEEVVEEKKKEEPKPEPNLLDPEQAERVLGARPGYAMTYIQRKNFSRMAEKYFHPKKGVRFFPFGLQAQGYSFTNAEMKDILTDSTDYVWGDIDGQPVSLTFQEYYDRYIYDVDFASASNINFNVLYTSGKSNLTFAQMEQQFPESIFVEYHKSGSSLILVFENPEGRSGWYISAIIHNQ